MKPLQPISVAAEQPNRKINKMIKSEGNLILLSFLYPFLRIRRLIMERSKKLLSLLDQCSDSENTKQMINEMCQELEQRQQKSGGKISRKGDNSK